VQPAVAARSFVTCFVPSWVKPGNVMKRIHELFLTRARNDLENPLIEASWAAPGDFDGGMHAFLILPSPNKSHDMIPPTP
jgi:hypothetical protein